MGLLLWLDQDPHRYWFVAYALLTATVSLALARVVSRRAQARPAAAWIGAIVAASAATTLFAFHWAAYFWEWPLDPDEAQMLAQAITATRAPIPWLSFDPTTSGPLNSLVLALPALAGVVPGYVTARVEATLLVFFSLVFFYRAMRSLYDDRIATVATLPVFVFFATRQSISFSGYSSELTPLFLCTLAFAGVCAVVRAGPRRAAAAAALAGLAAGAVFFAKLQLAPLATGAIVLGALALRARADLTRAQRVRAGLALAAGALVLPAIVLLPVIASGAFGDFVVSYVQTPLETLGSNRGFPVAMFFGAPDFASYFTASLAALIACWIALAITGRLGGARGTARAALAGGLALFAIALYAIYQPHRLFPHYLLIATFPLAAALGAAFGALAAPSHRPGVLRAAAAAFLAVTCVPSLVAAATGHSPFVGRLAQAVADRNADIPAPIAASIPGGSTIAVWGWMPQYYVVTRSFMATRDAITQFQLRPNPHQPYYRARYLRDLAASRPRYFIDAVAPGSFAFDDPATQGHETVPELARYVAANYHLTAAPHGIRLFERNAGAR